MTAVDAVFKPALLFLLIVLPSALAHVKIAPRIVSFCIIVPCQLHSRAKSVVTVMTILRRGRQVSEGKMPSIQASPASASRRSTSWWNGCQCTSLINRRTDWSHWTSARRHQYVAKGVRRILLRGVNAPLTPEAKKIRKIWLRNGAF